MKKRKGPQSIAETQHIEGYAKVVNSNNLPPYSCHRHVLIACHLSKAKISFQSSFMALISPIRFLNKAVETTVKVPNFESIW